MRVWGAAGADTTRDDGRYALAALPTGTHTLEVRAVGLAPARVAVDLAPGRDVAARVVMTAIAPELARVVVRGRAVAGSTPLDGFLARQRAGTGTYLTRAKIEHLAAFDATDIVRSSGAPSLHVSPTTSHVGLSSRGAPTGFGGDVLRGRGECIPAVYVDGTLLRDGADELNDVVRPESIEAMEIYSGAATIPAEYNLTGSGGDLTAAPQCGAVLVWTHF